MTGISTAKKLGIPTEQLHKLVELQLLVTGIPEEANSSRRKYYCRDSVERTGNFISTLVPVQDVCTSLGVKARSIHLRLRDLFHKSPINIGDTNYLDNEQVKILNNHFTTFWDAAQASEYLGVTKYDIHNWVRLGHLKIIEPGDAGYTPSIRLFLAESIKSAKSAGSCLRRGPIDP